MSGSTIDVALSAPRVEPHRDPLGIGEARPRTSVRAQRPPAGWSPHEWQLQVERDGAVHETPWGLGDGTLLPWPGAPLGSRERASVRARLRSADGTPSRWSPATQLEAGLLVPTDWTATAVSPGPQESQDLKAHWLRGQVEVPTRHRRARLYVTARGVHELEVNGRRVGDDVLSPGWTSYSQRLRYHTYDVTDLVVPGPNAVGGWLADGWFRGRLGFHGGAAARYGDTLALLAQLEVELEDGTVVVAGTGPDWRCAPSPVQATSLYDGERHDAGLEDPSWSLPDADLSAWSPVQAVDLDLSTLVAPEGPPVRATEVLRPVHEWRSPSGARILDFGQNLVGRLRITAHGRRGDTVQLRHAEIVQDGELCTRPLRYAEATDRYTLAGREDAETWEPRFTYHGFRYAEVDTGGDLAAADVEVEAVVLHTDMERTGGFSCSDPQLERLHENVVWSMRGNFVDIPTDCPQRDERLGWTGDLQAFAPTALFLYDCVGMLRSWLRDVAVEQQPDGNVPWYVPYIDTIDMWTPPRPSAIWGDVAVLTPWDLYWSTGDTQVLRDQVASARAWVDLVDRMAGPAHVWNSGYQLGDWLDPSAPPDDPAAAMTDPYLVATAYFARSARTLARTLALLGETEEAQKYADLSEDVAAAFVGTWWTEEDRLASDTQTAYALAICFDLLDGRRKAAAGDRLAMLVEDAGARIASGFAGTPFVCEALSLTGHDEQAYALVMQRECPSWLYAVEQGATTIWERWDSMLPDGTVNPGAMTSFNHYALGAVATWLHERVAGLRAVAPGSREVIFEPRPGGGLTHASAWHLSPMGRVEVSWRLDGSRLWVETTVPAGVDARLRLPDGADHTLTPGWHQHTCILEEIP